jgi:hypothetical protein
VVVHPKVYQSIERAVEVRVGAHNEQPGCLLAAPVAAGLLGSLERCQKLLLQKPLCLLESFPHRVEDFVAE